MIQAVVDDETGTVACEHVHEAVHVQDIRAEEMPAPVRVLRRDRIGIPELLRSLDVGEKIEEMSDIALVIAAKDVRLYKNEAVASRRPSPGIGRRERIREEIILCRRAEVGVVDDEFVT